MLIRNKTNEHYALLKYGHFLDFGDNLILFILLLISLR